MNIPQTNRGPINLSTSETAKLLSKRHPQDMTDYFATDPNPDIRQLGRLALRRNDINDLFALGDMCANRSVTDDGRLLVFYVGKTIIAYQKALRLADDDLDLAQARRAIRNFVDWVVENTQTNHSRRNIAVALWALAENEDGSETLRYEDEGLIQDLLDRYREESPTNPVKASIEDTSNSDDISDSIFSNTRADQSYSSVVEIPVVNTNRTTEDLTMVASLDFSETVNDLSQTVADFEEVPKNGLSNTEFESFSDTHLEQTALNSLISMEQEQSHPNRQLTEMPAARPNRDDDDEFAPGDWIEGRYEVSDVKRGGMGVVYLGYDRDKKEPVAIKTFQSRFLDNERAVSRFNHEATTWIMLEKHRYIVQARRVETIVGRPHIILEHISGPEGMGPDLRSWIDRKRLDLPQSMEFGLHIALGMQHASQRVPGLVHRDLKPANILVTHDAIAKITDFGLVRSLELTDVPLPGNDANADSNPRQNSANRLTRFGAIVGTAPYMSPEQCEAKDVDLRADIYAFGCILYEMLTGRQIFKEKKFNAWKQAHLNQTPAFDPQFERELPFRLQSLVMKCLEKSPDNRPPNWGAIVDELAVIYEEVTGQKATLEITGPEMQVHELIDKGYSLTELKRFDEALAAYDRAIALQPDNALAWARKGRALRLMERYDEGLAAYERALDIFPRYGWAWRGKGLVLERLNRLEEALFAYEQAVQIKPNEVWNWYNQADVMQSMNRYADAIPLLQKALEIDPQHPNSWAKLGQVYRLMGEQEDAVYAYEKAIDFEPEYAWAHNGRGLALKALKRYAEALVSFKRATQYEPNEVWHWYNLTEMLVELGQYNDALSPATQATRTDPSHAFSWAKLGQVLRHLNQNADALQAYDRAIQLQPTYSWAINGKGIVLERMGRLEDALNCYNRAAEIQDDYVWHCWYNQGNVLALMGRYKEALPILEKVTGVVPNHAQSWARMGNALRNLKQPEEGLKNLQQATLLDPKYTWAWNEMGITYEQLGQLDEALSAYQQAGRTAPKDPFYMTQQADILIQQGDNQHALDLLTQALKFDPRNARVWAKQGQTLRRLNRMDEALKSYTNAVELDPKYGWAWNGRGLTLSVLNRHEEALKAFRAATESGEQDAWYWYNLGDELVTLNRFSDSLPVLDKALELNPHHAESWAKRGQSLRRLNRHADALNAYDEALAVNPRYAWAWNGRGLALESLGRREEALASYERSIEEDPRVIWYYTNQIDVLLDMGHKGEAMIVAERATSMMPRNAVAWARKGQVQRRISNYQGALESYLKALELDPTYAWAWNGKGLAMAGLSRWAEAVTAYEQAVRYNMSDLWFWNNYGEALMSIKDYRRAVDAFMQAAAIDPRHEPTRQHLKQARDLLDGT